MIPLKVLSLKIPCFEIIEGVIYYSLTIFPSSDQSKAWSLKKRFKNFDELHKKLSKLYKNVPTRPKKTFFKMTKPIDLDQRRKDLEQYCEILIERKELLESEDVQHFFEIREHNPGLISQKLPTFGCIHDPDITNPIAAVQYDKKTNICIVVEQEVIKNKAHSHGNSKPSLLKFFELKSGIPSGKPFSIWKKWALQIVERVTCLKFSSLLNQTVCGTNEGNMYMCCLVQTNETIESKAVVNVHIGAIIDLCIEENEIYIISIGEDKKIVGTSFEGKTLFSSKVGNHPLRQIKLDINRHRAIISDTSGEIFIFDVQCTKAILIGTLLHPDITGTIMFCVNYKLNILACYLNTGEMKYSFYDESKKSEYFGKIALDNKVTVLNWHEEKNIIVIGNELGQLKFLDFNTGNIILTMQCHDSSINALEIDQHNGIIVTGSQDSSVYFWKWPFD